MEYARSNMLGKGRLLFVANYSCYRGTAYVAIKLESVSSDLYFAKILLNANLIV